MIVLASKSASRRAMLDAAGVAHEAIPASLDERALEARLEDCTPGEIAEALSQRLAKIETLGPVSNMDVSHMPRTTWERPAAGTMVATTRTLVAPAGVRV